MLIAYKYLVIAIVGILSIVFLLTEPSFTLGNPWYPSGEDLIDIDQVNIVYHNWTTSLILSIGSIGYKGVDNQVKNILLKRPMSFSSYDFRTRNRKCGDIQDVFSEWINELNSSYLISNKPDFCELSSIRSKRVEGKRYWDDGIGNILVTMIAALTYCALLFAFYFYINGNKID